MTNVITATNRFNNFSSADELYFPVTLQNIEAEYESPYANGGHPTTATNPKLRAVVREDTGRILGVVGEGYNLTHNRDLIGQFEEELRHSELDLTGMYEKTMVFDEGGSFVRSYHLPQHVIEPRVGTTVEMMMKLRGSYDGSTSTRAILGSLDLWCTNGAVSLNTWDQAYGRHTKNFEVSKFVEKFRVSAEIFLKNAEIWKHWAKKKIGTMDVTDLLEALDLGDQWNKDMLAQFRFECQDRGHQTVWELYSALTAWSTHKGSQTEQAKSMREKRVAKVIASPEFARLAA